MTWVVMPDLRLDQMPCLAEPAEIEGLFVSVAD